MTPAGADEGGDRLSNTEIKAAAFHGVRWTAASRLVAELSSVASIVVVARLVGPEAFGRVAVVSIALLLATTLFGEGLRVPLVQRDTLDRAHIEAAVLIALCAGLLLALVVGVALPPLATVAFDPQTADLFRLAALAFLVAGVAAVSQALLLRRLRFRAVAIVDTLTALSTAAVTTGLAVAGLEETALLLGPIAAQFLAAAVLLALAPVALPRWRRKEIGDLVRFGGPSMASGAVGTISRNIDYAVMAVRLDPASVGFYSRGYALGIEYQRRISAILQRLALPLYSRTRTLEDKLVLRSRIVRMQSLVIFPLMGGLIVLAPIVVPLVLGPQWDAAVAPTQILAAAGAVNAVESGIGPLLLAVGRPGVLLRFNLTNLVLFVALVWLVAPHGVVAVCVAVALFRVVRFGASLALLVRRIMGIPLLRIWLDVAPPLCATLALLGAGVVISEAAGAVGLPEWAWGVTFTLAAPFIYVAVLRRVFPEAFAQLGEMARGVLPARVAARV